MVAGKRTYPCEISHARVGVLVDFCRSSGWYDINNTNFVNNSYGVMVLNNQVVRSNAYGVRNCSFTSDPLQRRAPDNVSAANPAGRYTEAGMVLRGPNHQNLSYRGNTFAGLRVGVETMGEGVDLIANSFVRCYQAAIQVANSGGYSVSVNQLTVQFNNVSVPATPTPGGQISPASAATGIAILASTTTGTTLDITSNLVQGDISAPAGSRRRQIGLDGNLCFTNTNIRQQNRFYDLDEGIRLLDATGQLISGARVQNNRLENCPKGIVLAGQNAAVLSPVIGCNTLVDVVHGIEIEPGAAVGDFGTASTPVSNDYQGTVLESVYNDGALFSSNYYYNASSGNGNQEFHYTSTNPGIVYQQVFGYSCSTSYGLARGTNTNGDLTAMQEQISQQLGSDKDNRLTEQRLVRAYEDNGDFGDLREFVRTLPLQNLGAFGRLSIYLMEYYRQQGDEAQAEQTRDELLNHLGGESDISNRVAYFDVAGHLRELAELVPDAADVAALQDISSSGTSFAPVACATLRYFFPDYHCENQPMAGRATQPNGAASAQRRVAAAKAAANGRLAGQLVASPNPASETVRVSFTASKPLATPATFQLVAVATGRVLLNQKMPASGQLEVYLAGVPAGVYLGRVLGESQAASCKIVVVH